MVKAWFLFISFKLNAKSSTRLEGDEANVQRGCICSILQMNLIHESRKCEWVSWVESAPVCHSFERIIGTGIVELNATIIGNRESSLFWAPRKRWIELNWIITVSLWIQKKLWIAKMVNLSTSAPYHMISKP